MSRVTKADLLASRERLERSVNSEITARHQAQQRAKDLENHLGQMADDLQREREGRLAMQAEAAELRGKVDAYREVLVKAGLIGPPRMEVKMAPRAERRSDSDFERILAEHNREVGY